MIGICDLDRRGKSAFPSPLRRTLLPMLGEREQAVLDFESSWWLYPGPKDRAIREYLGMSATRYYQVLRRLLDDPEAQRHAPLTVRRLRKVREDARRRAVAKRLDERRGG